MYPSQMILLTVGNCFVQGFQDTQTWSFISPKTSTRAEKLGNASSKRAYKFQLGLSHLTALLYLPNTRFIVGFTVGPWEAYYVQTYGLGLSTLMVPAQETQKIFSFNNFRDVLLILGKVTQQVFFLFFFLLVIQLVHTLHIAIFQLELHRIFIYKYKGLVGVSWL